MLHVQNLEKIELYLSNNYIRVSSYRSMYLLSPNTFQRKFPSTYLRVHRKKRDNCVVWREDPTR